MPVAVSIPHEKLSSGSNQRLLYIIIRGLQVFPYRESSLFAGSVSLFRRKTIYPQISIRMRERRILQAAASML